MAIRRYRKDPDSTIPYGFDWSHWLASDSMPASEAITDATWTVPSGITGANPQNDGSVTKIDISGGTAGEVYTIACKVETTSGYIDERSFEIKVVDR